MGLRLHRTPTPTPEPTPTPGPIPTPEPETDAPGRPAGLQVETETDSLDVSVDWDDVAGATSYKVRWRVAGPGNALNEGLEVQSSNADITVADYGEWIVRVEACDGADCGSPATLRFEVETSLANSPPTFDEGAGPLTRSVAENSLADSAVGAAVAATDPDADTLTYTLTGDDAGSFTIDANGQIEVGQGTTFDRATTASYSVTVNVSDGKDSSGGDDTAVDASVDVTISVTGPVLPPFFPAAITALFFDEAGEIDDVTLAEAEGGEGDLTYTLTGLPAGLSFDADSRILSGSVPAASTPWSTPPRTRPASRHRSASPSSWARPCGRPGAARRTSTGGGPTSGISLWSARGSPSRRPRASA